MRERRDHGKWIGHSSRRELGHIPGGVGGLDLRCGILGVIAATLLTDYANKDISDEYNRIERARASVG